MKIVVPVRHRRLLALCAGSALVHLALLDLVARHGGGAPAALPAPGSDLVLRLAPPPPRAQPRPATARQPAQTQAPALAPARQAGSVPPPKPALAAAPTQPPPARPATSAGAPGAVASGDAPAPPLAQMPGRYRVRAPDSFVLTYAQAVQQPGAAPVAAGSARIDWHTDGATYRLDVDGVTGRLHSEGSIGDAGIVPRRAVEMRGEAVLATDFDDDTGRVLFRAGGGEAPGNIGIQDPASLLVQLAGIGLGEPGQLLDRIDVVVADSAQAQVVRLKVMEMEDVATGIGTVAARRLAQVAAPGQPRMEVWLAPEHGWLPVRIRVSRADGSTATQTLAARAPGP